MLKIYNNNSAHKLRKIFEVELINSMKLYSVYMEWHLSYIEKNNIIEE
jgi:hypothetical protein